MVDSGCEMSRCNVRGALGSQARIGEVRELQVGFEFRRIQASPDPTRGLASLSLSCSCSWAWVFPVATHDPWLACGSRADSSSRSSGQFPSPKHRAAGSASGDYIMGSCH